MKNSIGCNEEFAELCALSTTGELSAQELAALKEHVSGCAACASLLDEYAGFVHAAMAKLAAEREQDLDAPFAFNEARGEERFMAALQAAQPAWHTRLRWQNLMLGFRACCRSLQQRVPDVSLSMAVALLVVAGLAFGAGHVTVKAPAPAVALQPRSPDPETETLKLQLAAARESLTTATAKSSDLERRLAELTAMKESLSAQIGDLASKDEMEAASLALANQQQYSLEQQLQETSSALVRAKDDLSNAQRERQGVLLRVASLETEVKVLNANLAVTNTSAGNDEKLLSADRDIRELMGARQLYISDVFDVQNNGTPSKPFGRVFYTKGKSLVFYAFDLQAQPDYREAKAFQAWGKLDNTSAKPISLGIFYLDNEQNRRWVLKSNNQQALAEINAVFVTVEPHGGSQKPTGKPFLEAYLHSLPPNHP